MFGLFRKNKDNEVWINISSRTIIRVLVLVLLSLIMLNAIRRSSHALLLIFTAFFLALALNAPVHWLAEHLPGKRRGSRVLATATSFLVVVIILGAFVASIVPPLVRQTNSFINAAPGLVQEVRDQNGALGSFVRRYRLQDQVDKFANQLSDRTHSITGSALSTAGHFLTSIFSVLTILALTFMMLVEGPYWINQITRLVPEDRRGHVSKIAADMYRVIRGYVNGQVILAAIAAVLITPALFIAHVSYPLALMAIIFICGLIPLVGHTIGAIIVTVVALFHSIPAGIVILIYYLLYQQIENYVIQPRIQANTTNLSPLLVFAAVVIGVSFDGIFGGLVAIPVMGCLRIIVIDYLTRHNKLVPQEVKADTK